MVFQPQRCKVHLLNSAPLRRATWVSGMQTGSITLPTRLDPSSVKTWRHWVSVEQEVTEHTTFDQRQSVPHFPLQRDALSRAYSLTLKKSSAYCKICWLQSFFFSSLHCFFKTTGKNQKLLLTLVWMEAPNPRGSYGLRQKRIAPSGHRQRPQTPSVIIFNDLFISSTESAEA